MEAKLEKKSPTKKTIPFIEILQRSAKIVWNNRFLLWFGFLMALGAPGNFNVGKDRNEFGTTGESARDFLASHWQIAVLIAFILFAVGIFLLLISLVAKAGLVKSVDFISRKKEASFREGWRTGKKYFRRLFGLSVLFALVVFLIVTVLAIPVVYLVVAKSWVGAVLVGLLAIAIFVPLIFIFSLTKIFAEFYIVLSDLHLRSAIEAGYELLLKNIGNSIIFALLLVAVSLVAGIVLLPVAGLALVVLVPAGFAFYYLSKVAFGIFLAIAIMLFLAVILFVSSIFQTFKMTAWTLFFKEIAKVEKPEAESATEEAPQSTVATTPASQSVSGKK